MSLVQFDPNGKFIAEEKKKELARGDEQRSMVTFH